MRKKAANLTELRELKCHLIGIKSYKKAMRLAQLFCNKCRNKKNYKFLKKTIAKNVFLCYNS